MRRGGLSGEQRADDVDGEREPEPLGGQGLERIDDTFRRRVVDEGVDSVSKLSLGSETTSRATCCVRLDLWSPTPTASTT